MNKTSTVSVPFMVLGILFTVCLIVSNILEVKLIEVAGISATGGLLVFPISYIINDCIAEIWGFRKARLIIWSAFAMNFLVVGLFQLAVMLPPAGYWEGQEAFRSIFAATPRIAVASFIAFLVGSFLNAFVMSKMKMASNGKNFSLRAIVSTLVGESADSIIFFPIAFAGIVPTEELLLLVGTQALLKTAYEIVILPVTVRVVKYIKKIDNSDVYDSDISYNVFKIKEV